MSFSGISGSTIDISGQVIGGFTSAGSQTGTQHGLVNAFGNGIIQNITLVFQSAQPNLTRVPSMRSQGTQTPVEYASTSTEVAPTMAKDPAAELQMASAKAADPSSEQQISDQSYLPLAQTTASKQSTIHDIPNSLIKSDEGENQTIESEEVGTIINKPSTSAKVQIPLNSKGLSNEKDSSILQFNEEVDLEKHAAQLDKILPDEVADPALEELKASIYGVLLDVDCKNKFGLIEEANEHAIPPKQKIGGSAVVQIDILSENLPENQGISTIDSTSTCSLIQTVATRTLSGIADAARAAVPYAAAAMFGVTSVLTYQYASK